MVSAFGNLEFGAPNFTHARLQTQCEIGNLHAGIVVIKFARYIPAGVFEQRRNAVAQRRLTPVSHMQGSGWIGRHEFNVDELTVSCIAAAPLLGVRENLQQATRLKSGVKAKVDEPGAGDLGTADAHRFQLHARNQRLGDFARLFAKRLGQRHRSVGVPIAVTGFPRTFQHHGDICRSTQRDGGPGHLRA